MIDDIKPDYWIGWNPQDGGDYIIYAKEPSEYQRNRFETEPLYDQATVEAFATEIRNRTLDEAAEAADKWAMEYVTADTSPIYVSEHIQRLKGDEK